MNTFSGLKKLAQTVMPVTCLAAVAVINASAGTITESGLPGGSFGSTFGTATLLPAGTDTVIGGLCNQCRTANNDDWFEISGLSGGSTVTVTESVTSDGSVTFLIYDSTQSTLQSNYGVTQVGGSVTTPFTVPTDGNLFFDVENPNLNTTPTAYQITVTGPQASDAPEPGTFGAGVLGLVSMLGLGRRLRRN